MSIFRNHLPIMGASGQSTGEYEIKYSARFDRDNSASLIKTFGTPTDQKKWTLSAWTKIPQISTESTGGQTFIDTGTTAGSEALASMGSSYAGYEYIYFWDRTSSSYNWRLQTNHAYKDPAAWYHVVFHYDSAQLVNAERAKIFVNGLRVTDFAHEDYPSLNYNGRINTASQAHGLMKQQYSSSPAYREGMLAEYHFMDGYIYGPEYFGKFDDNNNWIPIQVTGVSYGNNGFYFPFSNSSNFGEDFSGNDNDFASNGLDAHDQLTDTPSNNFARYNSIGTSDDRGTTTQANLKNANLQFNSGGPAYVIGLTIDNHMLDGGKWYFEICLKTSSGFNTTIGFRNADNGDDTPSIEVESDGQIKKDSGNEGSATGAFSDGDIIGIRLDWSNTASRKISFYKNNTIITGQQTFSDSSSIAGFMFYSRESGSGATHHLNTGQNGTFNGNKTAQGNSDGNGIGDFFYSVPADHLAICSRNLFE